MVVVADEQLPGRLARVVADSTTRHQRVCMSRRPESEDAYADRWTLLTPFLTLSP